MHEVAHQKTVNLRRIYPQTLPAGIIVVDMAFQLRRSLADDLHVTGNRLCIRRVQIFQIASVIGLENDFSAKTGQTPGKFTEIAAEKFPGNIPRWIGVIASAGDDRQIRSIGCDIPAETFQHLAGRVAADSRIDELPDASAESILESEFHIIEPVHSGVEPFRIGRSECAYADCFSLSDFFKQPEIRKFTHCMIPSC